MQKGNLNVLVEYEEERFSPEVLMNEPGSRMVMLSLRARQNIPEHASRGMVTVYIILGHVTLFAGPFPDELYAGQVICIESGVRHRIEAFEDSVLLVLFRRFELLYGGLRRQGESLVQTSVKPKVEIDFTTHDLPMRCARTFLCRDAQHDHSRSGE